MIRSWYIFFAMLLCSTTVGLADTPQTQEEMDRRNLRKLARANNDMALNLYKEIASGTSDNFFISPLSLSTVFGMLYYGSKGRTAEELRKVLGYEAAGLEEGLVHRTFHQYLTEILPSKDPSTYVLNSANAILIDKYFDLISSYKKDVQEIYHASIQDVDFNTQGPEIVEEINDWVKQKTNGKIDKLLDKLDSSTALVLLNAVYFKGIWKNQFDPRDTTLGTFYNYGLRSEAKQVPTMRLEDEFYIAYDADLNTRAIEIPYKGGNMTMILLLPNKLDGLELLEKSQTLEKMVSIKRKMEKRKVTLMIPKFKIQFSKEMDKDFESLGARSIFSPEADFSGMTTANVFVSRVIHKAAIEVNEEGSEAAAASAIIFSRNANGFSVDHPFTFAILDKRNDMILFTGRVTNL